MSPTRELWDRLARPIQHFDAVAAMLGLSQSAVELLQAALLATSPETEELIDALPSLSRSMAIATTDVPVRSVGSVRGPILWSETMAARASSFGDPGLFVCASTTRAYDTAENRVLAFALKLVADAARTVDDKRAMGHENEIANRVRHIEAVAARQLESRTLSGVPRARPTGRDIRRTRAGNRRKTYLPALAVLERAGIPFDAEDVESVTDQTSSTYHAIFLRVADLLTARGHDIPRFRAAEGLLFAGPISFRHPAHRGEVDHPVGIVVGDTVLVVPGADSAAARRAGHSSSDLPDSSQAGGRTVVPVHSPDDVESALGNVAL